VLTNLQSYAEKAKNGDFSFLDEAVSNSGVPGAKVAGKIVGKLTGLFKGRRVLETEGDRRRELGIFDKAGAFLKEGAETVVGAVKEGADKAVNAVKAGIDELIPEALGLLKDAAEGKTLKEILFEDVPDTGGVLGEVGFFAFWVDLFGVCSLFKIELPSRWPALKYHLILPILNCYEIFSIIVSKGSLTSSQRWGKWPPTPCRLPSRFSSRRMCWHRP
jgi:hypothetical protein